MCEYHKMELFAIYAGRFLLYNAAMKFLKAHKNDILLILAVLILAGGVWVYTLCTRSHGGEAVVTVDGEEVLRAPLSEPRTYIRQDPSGEVLNTVVIRDGRVCVESASCPDKICVNQRQIDRTGETITCLPNKTVVKIVAADPNASDDIDFMS